MFSSPRLRLLLFVVASALAAAVGFVLVPPLQAVRLVQHGGYFVMLAATLAFVVAVVRLVRPTPRASWWSPADTRLALGCLVIALLWQVNGSHGFKIVMDELVLNATGMSMHFDRQAFVPLKTHEVNGIYLTTTGIVDKRPLFFPFLLSGLHDVTGYRPANAFVLNGLLSFVLLFATGRVSRRLGGQEAAGWLGVLLLGGLPLAAINATGGGFELLNLVMILVVLALAWRYLETPEEKTLDPLLLGTVLLAQTRYESALFVAATGAIMLHGWWRVRRPVTSWGLVAAPLLLLPIPLLERLFRINDAYWQVREGDVGAWSLNYLAGNFGHAFEFLFTVDGFQLSSPVLSVFGLVTLIFFAIYVLRRWRRVPGEPGLAALVALGAVIFANFLLLLFYHWGQLNDFVATRLSLPLLLLFTLAAAFVFGRWVQRRTVWLVVLAAPAAWLFLGSLPLVERAGASRMFLAAREVAWQQEFVREHQVGRNFFAFTSPLAAVIERQPAITTSALAERAPQMAYHLSQHTYDNVWVFEHFEVGPVTGAEIPDERTKLGPEFQLEIVAERRFKPLHVARISRLVAIDLSLVQPRPPGHQPRDVPFEFTAIKDDPNPEGAYIQEFLRQLP